MYYNNNYYYYFIYHTKYYLFEHNTENKYGTFDINHISFYMMKIIGKFICIIIIIYYKLHLDRYSNSYNCLLTKRIVYHFLN